MVKNRQFTTKFNGDRVIAVNSKYHSDMTLPRMLSSPLPAKSCGKSKLSANVPVAVMLNKWPF